MCLQRQTHWLSDRTSLFGKVSLVSALELIWEKYRLIDNQCVLLMQPKSGHLLERDYGAGSASIFIVCGALVDPCMSAPAQETNYSGLESFRSGTRAINIWSEVSSASAVLQTVKFMCQGLFFSAKRSSVCHHFILVHAVGCWHVQHPLKVTQSALALHSHCHKTPH